MKTLKALAFWFSFFMLTPFLASCDDDNEGSDKDNENKGNNSELVGTWRGTSGSIVFGKNGDFQWKGDTGKYTYDAKEDILTVTWDNPEKYEDADKVEYYFVDLDGDELILTHNGKDGYSSEYEFFRDNTPEETNSILGQWYLWDENDVFFDAMTFFPDGHFVSEEQPSGTYKYIEEEGILIVHQGSNNMTVEIIFHNPDEVFLTVVGYDMQMTATRR